MCQAIAPPPALAGPGETAANPACPCRQQILHFINQGPTGQAVVGRVLRIGFEIRPHPVRHLDQRRITRLAKFRTDSLEPLIQGKKFGVDAPLRKIARPVDESWGPQHH
jgi:hypothetical protein